MMKKFEAPRIEVKRFGTEDVFTNSSCTTQALGCTSCYCSAVSCDHLNPTCTSDCYSDLGF